MNFGRLFYVPNEAQVILHRGVGFSPEQDELELRPAPVREQTAMV